MTSQLRAGIVALKPTPTLSGAVECDEVYLVAGHKGHPEAVKKRAKPRRRDEGRTRARTLATEKPPVFGMLERADKSSSGCSVMSGRRQSGR